MKLNPNKILITTGIFLIFFGVTVSFTGITGYFILPTNDKKVNNLYGSGISVFGLGLMILGTKGEKEKPYDFGGEAESLLSSLTILGEDAKTVEKSRKGFEEFEKEQHVYKQKLQGRIEKLRERYDRLENTAPERLDPKEHQELYELNEQIDRYKAQIEGIPEKITERNAYWQSKLAEFKEGLKEFADRMLEFSKKYTEKEKLDKTEASYSASLRTYLEGFLRASYVSGILKGLPEVSKKLNNALTYLETKSKREYGVSREI